MSQENVGMSYYANTPTPALRHSGLGIASFIIACLAGLVEVGGITAAAILTMQAGGRLDPNSPAAIIGGLVIIGGIGVALIGGVLGVVGLFLPGRKKLFAILGTVFNGMVVLGVVGLMVLGMMA